MTNEEIRQKVLDGFHELDVTFDRVSELGFYLAVPIEQILRIDPKQFDAIKDALGVQKLDAYFDEYWYEEPSYDETGAIVGLPVGNCSDIWPFEDLEKIAKFVDEGSYILGQDDEDRFFKIWFEGGAVHYGEGTPSKPFIPERHSWMGIVDADDT